MQADIRKIKVTTSILKQSSCFHMSQIKNEGVLGWCVHIVGKKRREKVVFQLPKGKLKWYPRIYGVRRVEEISVQVDEHGAREPRWKVVLNCHGVYPEQEFKTEVEAKSFACLIREVVELSDKEGQFYL